MDRDDHGVGGGLPLPSEHGPEPGSFIELTPEELKRVLEDHRKWGYSAGAQGARADLSHVNLGETDLQGVNLAEANLQGANLHKANLQGASLAKANLRGTYLGGANLQKASLWESNLQDASLALASLQGANLREANLSRANLREANLSRANLSRANLEDARLSLATLHGTLLSKANLQRAVVHHAELHEANLQEANLLGVKGLQIKQLRGANASGAELPAEIGRFEWLDHVEEASKKSGRLFLAVLVACFYAWLAVAATQPISLITRTVPTPLPILGTSIPIVGFYWIAPLALLILYIYFHLYLQRLWEDLSAFPAVFPDGKTLDQKVYPWLLNGLARAYVAHLQDMHLPFYSLQRFVSILTAWALVPITIAFIGYGYLPKHDPLGSVYHALLLAGSVWLAIVFYLNTVATLHGEQTPPFVWKEAHADRRTRIASAIFFAGILLWAVLFFSPFRLPAVELISADLRGADLSGAHLEDARLVGADLRAADLSGTHLQGAMLFSALLNSADLRGAHLNASDLKGANLQDANLTGADLTGADLRGTQLQGALLEGVLLEGAQLARAHLLEVEGLTYEQLCTATSLKGAELDATLVAEVTTHCVEQLMETPEAPLATPPRTPAATQGQ